MSTWHDQGQPGDAYEQFLAVVWSQNPKEYFEQPITSYK